MNLDFIYKQYLKVNSDIPNKILTGQIVKEKVIERDHAFLFLVYKNYIENLKYYFNYFQIDKMYLGKYVKEGLVSDNILNNIDFIYDEGKVIIKPNKSIYRLCNTINYGAPQISTIKNKLSPIATHLFILTKEKTSIFANKVKKYYLDV